MASSVSASRVSTLAPSGTCLFPVPDKNFNLDQRGLHGSYYIENHCLTLKKNPGYSCSDFLNLTSSETSSYHQTFFFWSIEFVDPKPNEVFLTNPVFGTLTQKLSPKVTAMNFLPLPGTVLALYDMYGYADENPFGFTYNRNERQSWAIEAFDIDAIECDKNYFFQVLSIDSKTSDVIDSAEVIINVQQSLCFDKIDEGMKFKQIPLVR